MTTVNGANARTNAATIQTSHPALSPVFGEMNALCDSVSLLQGVVPSEYHSAWMLTAVGVAWKLGSFCVCMEHHDHPKTCTHIHTIILV
jgi:hypothetical protein